MDKLARVGVSRALRRPCRSSAHAVRLSSSVPSSSTPEKKVRYETGFPNLMNPDPVLDRHIPLEFPPSKKSPFTNRVVIRPSLKSLETNRQLAELAAEAETSELPDAEEARIKILGYSSKQLKNLVRIPIFSRRITQQTGKGKIHRMYAMVVVGNGDGLVGYGEGKDEDAPRASEKAFVQAVRNMDWVERFEKRTIWTEMETKLGATRIILRPRPVGFGLRCNPNIHEVLKAAGIKDISAKVWGSRNPLNVIKALFRMLQAGNAPLSMGDGIGGSARKLNKGTGLRNKTEVERERGRKLIDLRN